MPRKLFTTGAALLSFLLAFALSGDPAYCQPLTLKDSVNISSPDQMTIDRSGNIYVSDIKGNLYKFDPLLQNPLIYSPPQPARITSLNAWQTLRIFLFFRETQEFTLLNRFLESPATYRFRQDEIGFVAAATPSFDNKLWLLEQTTMNLVKYDYQNRQIEFKKPLDLIVDDKLHDIILFREYQNRIYIGDNEGNIYIFDTLGNFVAGKQMPKVKWIDFYKDTIYYFFDGKLVLENMYTGEQSTKLFDLPAEIKKIILTEGRFYALTEKKLYYFSGQ